MQEEQCMVRDEQIIEGIIVLTLLLLLLCRTT